MLRRVLSDSIKRELHKLSERHIYLFAMVIIPISVLLLLTSLMSDGLPLHIPTAVVDLDNTVETRAIVRNLKSSQEVEITHKVRDYAEAVQLMKEGKIYGFFVIPYNFTRDAMAGKSVQVSYYTNSTFYIPGSLLYKSLKTTSTLTSAAVVSTYLISAGATERQVQTLLQPVKLQTNMLSNPWTHYSVYISNSFVPCALALIIFLVTAFSICTEEKRGTSRGWLAAARGSMTLALAGKLLPHTVIFSAVGLFVQAYMFGFLHYPINCSVWIMIMAMIIFVVANQALAGFICGILPNLRWALSVSCLFGMLSFSIGAFSFPLEDMYGSIAIFSYIIPSRYYFLIYADQALNGFPLYYSRMYFAALLAFLLLPFLVMKRLKKAQLNPVYVP